MQIPAGPSSRRRSRGPLACGSQSRRSGPDATCNSRPAAGGRQSATAPCMPARERPQPRAGRPHCQPRPSELRTRPRKIVFADELQPRAPLHPEKHPRDLGPRPNPVPDYELRRFAWQLMSEESLRRSGWILVSWISKLAVTT
ncbi:rCG38810, isoform CRA_c [Rattus norvegicus]|uniref:Occludin/ELL domain containing 1 n=2 Tax=Rattus norvegicus TaxID=10116 RepID=A0ABK0LMB3_RAT|nr:occludin/ELL domain-containing protein 1 isoform X4 [Rattus norvegicus]EDL90811.1 rCG38810, isoform CRA_c [Rattus norvegicus]|eukprot:XP_008769302.1 PREDICTED: occludin/ELL domain-containing protein 1 isoform X3 [Rattus norvegicus]